MPRVRIGRRAARPSVACEVERELSVSVDPWRPGDIGRRRARLQMVVRACTLAGLVVVAALRQAVSQPTTLYACQNGECVPSARGLPLAECVQACASVNYTCTGGQCVVASRGLPKAACTQVCGGPAPPPPGPPIPFNNKTVVDLALATPELSTLVKALKAAGLVDALSGKVRPLTDQHPSRHTPPAPLQLPHNCVVHDGGCMVGVPLTIFGLGRTGPVHGLRPDERSLRLSRP